MKSQKRVSPPVTSGHPLDAWIVLTLITSASLLVGSLPIVFSSQIANSAANNPALWGEAGLWGDLGQKEPAGNQ